MGCNTTGRIERDGLSYNERQARLEAGVEDEPGVWERTGEAASFVFKDVPKWAWEQVAGEAPVDYARQLRSELPSQRRAALLNLAERDFGDGEDYVLVYKDAALSDPDPLVRAAGVRALNLARAEESALFVRLLGDEVPAVQLEAAKALTHQPDPDAVGPLLSILEGGGDLDLRIAAADALRHYPRLDVARGLANATGDREFGLAWQAGESLRYLTGQELAYDPGDWLGYLADAERPFG